MNQILPSHSNDQPSMAARTASVSSGMLAASQQSLPTIPAGQTTVLSQDELNRIRTTLLHADAKTKGSQILSEAVNRFFEFSCDFETF